MSTVNTFILCWATLLACYWTRLCFSAVAHSHSHVDTNRIHKERVEDGAISPNDHSHYDEHGQHRSEFDHEAILGSTKEAEEFDHLPPEEAKRRLRLLLGKMDLNKDQNIDRKELKSWILRSFRMLSAEESLEKFEDADENDDKAVSWVEYAQDNYNMEEQSEEGLDSSEKRDIEEENKMMETDKIMYDAADKNSDGLLTVDEFALFTHPEEHPEMLPLILKQTLIQKDSNNDGSIDFQEYVGARGAKQDKSWLISEKEKFDEYDSNNDGILDSQEIIAWIVPSNEVIAEDEAGHLFASSDDNHDDLLSFDEVLDHYSTFVGSEATDYGDHLHNIHRIVDEL